MFCPKCGKENSSAALFCRECGAKINTPAQPSGGPVSIPAKPAKAAVPKVGLKYKVLIIEAALCAAVIAAFFILGSRFSKPEKIAEKYFQREMAADWEKVYDYLDLPKSDLLTRESFVASKEETGAVTYSNYKMKSFKSNKFTATAEIEYRESGDKENKTRTISMTKARKKKLLFFDDWQVSSIDFLAADTMLVIPKGLEVSLDGEDISEYIQKAEDGEEEWDYYKIPQLFSGIHTLEMSHEQMEGLSGTMTIPSGSDFEYYGSELEMEKAVKEELFDQACDDMGELYRGAVENEGYEELAVTFSEDGAKDEELADRFETLRSYYNDKNGLGIETLELSSFAGDVTQSYQAGRLSAAVKIEFDYDCRASRKGWSGEVSQVEEEAASSAVLTYVYEDGSWVLEHYKIPDIYS